MKVKVMNLHKGENCEGNMLFCKIVVLVPYEITETLGILGLDNIG